MLIWSAINNQDLINLSTKIVVPKNSGFVGEAFKRIFKYTKRYIYVQYTHIPGYAPTCTVHTFSNFMNGTIEKHILIIGTVFFTLVLIGEGALYCWRPPLIVFFVFFHHFLLKTSCHVIMVINGRGGEERLTKKSPLMPFGGKIWKGGQKKRE